MDQRDKLCADCWKRGTEAMQKQNWDYAIEMFGTCVNLKPGNVVYRQSLRGCERSKYKDNGTGAGALAKAKLMSIRGRIKKAKAKEDWVEADKAIEEGLRINPWDTQLNSDLAEVAEAQDYMEIAEFARKTAVEANPKSKELILAYADILERRGNYTQAVKALEAALRLDPTDVAIERRITNVQTRQTTSEGGFEDAESSSDVRVRRTMPAQQGEMVAPGQSEEADLKHAIRKEPDKIEHYQKLATYYRANRQFEEAREVLKTAVDMSGNDPAYREQLEDVELELMRRNRDLAREAATRDTSDTTARSNWEELEKELVKRELEIYLSRESRYDKDMRLKLDIAQRFMRFGKWGEAIPRLQKAAQDTRLRPQALARLGICLWKDGKTQLARAQLDRAVPDLNYERDPKLFKEVYYNLGRICEELKDYPGAEKAYGEILVVDYGYRDTNDRLSRIQESQPSGGGD